MTTDAPARATRRRRARRRIACLLAGLLLPTALTAGPAPDAPLPPPRPPQPAGRTPTASEASVPLPPPRPPELARPVFGPPMPTAAERAAAPSPPGPAPTPAPVAGPTPDLAEAERVCAALLASGKVMARATAPVSGPGECGMAAPIEIAAVVVSPSLRIAFHPPPAMNCALGTAVADWVREDLVPLFAQSGAALATLSDTSGYACRSRDHIAGAKLSEHARGNAMDIGGFVTADHKTVGLKDAPILAEVKRTACARFTTVLGPGSDSFHASHLHVDLAPRHNGTRICQWTLP